MSEFPRKLSIVLLYAVLGFCIDRARTQSFTVDEAWVFNAYVNQPLTEMARFDDVGNHVLHTLAMKFFRWWLGTGELALRIPTLIGAALYFRAVYLLSVLLFRSWMQLLAVAVMVLHPMVLDFSSRPVDTALRWDCSRGRFTASSAISRKGWTAAVCRWPESLLVWPSLRT